MNINSNINKMAYVYINERLWSIIIFWNINVPLKYCLYIGNECDSSSIFGFEKRILVRGKIAGFGIETKSAHRDFEEVERDTKLGG